MHSLECICEAVLDHFVSATQGGDSQGVRPFNLMFISSPVPLTPRGLSLSLIIPRRGRVVFFIVDLEGSLQGEVEHQSE